MSEGTVSTKRQYLTIFILICVLSGVSYLLYYHGRQHKIIIDNRAVEGEDGTSYRSLAGALVAVNHQTLSRDEITETDLPLARRPWISFKFWPKADVSVAKAVEMMPRERILIKTLGPDFNLKVEVYDRMGQAIDTIETDVHLGTRREGMIRLVKLHNKLPGPLLDNFPNDARDRPAPDEEEPPAADPDGLPETPSLGDM